LVLDLEELVGFPLVEPDVVVDFFLVDLDEAFFTVDGVVALTVAPADEMAVVELVVVQMLLFEPLGTEPGQPHDQFRSTDPLMPAMRPVARYCQKVHAFQPPGSGIGRAALVWLAIHSGYLLNLVVSEM